MYYFIIEGNNYRVPTYLKYFLLFHKVVPKKYKEGTIIQSKIFKIALLRFKIDKDRRLILTLKANKTYKM